MNGKVPALDSSPNAAVPRPNKVNIESKSPSPVEQAAAGKMDKGGLAQKEGPGTARSSPGPVKRKATSVGPKIKRLRMDNEESMELKITWEEAQELLRPPLKAPLIVIVDGHEFEEYEVCHAFQHFTSWPCDIYHIFCCVSLRTFYIFCKVEAYSDILFLWHNTSLPVYLNTWF